MALLTPLPSRDWQPLGSWDLVVISISCCIDMVAMLLMLHVLLNRRWLPYVTKIPYLIVYTALSVSLVIIILHYARSSSHAIDSMKIM